MESCDFMKNITDEVTTLYSSKYLATILNVSPVTLKKYSLLIEKISEGAVLFSRNDDKSRNYSDSDVLLIKRTLDIREEEGITYENAVTKVLIEQNIIEDTDVQIGISANVPQKNLSDGTAEAFIDVMNKQNDRIKELIESQEQIVIVNREQTQQIKNLLAQNQLLLEKIQQDSSKEDNSEKKMWWQFWK